jgi:GntR family transcriptional regulator
LMLQYKAYQGNEQRGHKQRAMDENLVRSSDGTLYHQLLSRLLKALESGKITVGEKLPTEAELVQSYGVSRTTARRALDELRRQGLVRREPGKGTFRIEPLLKADLPYLHSFSDEIRHLGYRPGVRLLLQQETVASEVIAEQLQVETGSPVLSFRRVRTADERPIFVCDSYLPLTRFPQLREADYTSTSLYQLFEQVLRLKIIRATQWISAITAPSDITGLLEIAVGSPVLQLQRITFVEGNLPIETVQAFFRSDRYQYYSELVAPLNFSDAVMKP